MEHVTIGLIGLGTVGTGVARLLTEHADRIARRAGRPSAGSGPRFATWRSRATCRSTAFGSRPMCQLIDDPEVDVIIETMGGIEPALAVSCSRRWPRASTS